MPAITSANLANAIVKLVAADALPALVGNLVMGNLVNRDYEPVLAQAGDTVNIPIAPSLVANNLVEGNAVTLQNPNVGNAQRGITYEQDGYVPHCRGIFDKDGRLIVVINWNTDMGDAWEWAESPYYPLKYSTFAWEMAINFIVYAMSH